MGGGAAGLFAILKARTLYQNDDGGHTWARTKDPLIKSQLLYQLSYASIPFGKRRASMGIRAMQMLCDARSPPRRPFDRH